MRRFTARFALCLIALSLLLGLPASSVLAQPQSTATNSKGERVFVCGHSFHRFITQPLELLAKEAGFDHVNLGEDFIGGSYPIQHWKRPDDKNPVKQALNAGSVDVLTLALNRELPDPGVDLFANLAINKNPRARVMLQISWLPWDGQDQRTFARGDHDRATAETLRKLEAIGDQYLAEVRKQALTLDRRAGKNFVYVVPVGPALLRLRKMVLKGELPGIDRQSELFTDAMGHPATPLKNLASYCWFAAVYRKNPEGLAALDVPGNEASKKLNRVLARVAWETVTAEPASGVKPPERMDR